METQNNFAIGSIPKHIMSIAGPMIVAQLINVLYNVIDRIYIGRIPHVATLAMGGLGICLPIISIVMAFVPGDASYFVFPCVSSFSKVLFICLSK